IAAVQQTEFVGAAGMVRRYIRKVTTMSKKATLNATIDTAAFEKKFEMVFATGRKSQQEAYISGNDAAQKAFKINAETVKTSNEKAVAEGKSNYEKAVKAFESSHFYDKNSAEAFITAGNAAVEKGEKIGTALLELGTERIQEIFKVAKTLAET